MNEAEARAYIGRKIQFWRKLPCVTYSTLSVGTCVNVVCWNNHIDDWAITVKLEGSKSLNGFNQVFEHNIFNYSHKPHEEE